MLHPRVLFLGDPAAAAPYVGIAKKLARETFAARIRSKVYRLGEAAIRIENTIPTNNAFGQGFEQTFGGISKVWIEAKTDAPAYQFLCSTPTPTLISFDLIPGTYLWAGGSAVSLKLPTIPATGPVDFSKTKAIATGSTVEGDGSQWPIQPLTYDGLIACQRWPAPLQIQWIPEPIYQRYAATTGAVKKPVATLGHAWVSQPGQIRQSNTLFLSYFGNGDVLYDAAPSKSRRVVVAPDADWYHDAAVYAVTSEDYGNRSFIVMVDAMSRFYCWPALTAPESGLYDPDYISQGIKTNIADAQSALPPMPAWGHLPTGSQREYWKDNGVQLKEPRYPWAFHPTLPRAVGMLVERDTPNFTVYHQTRSAVSGPPTGFVIGGFEEFAEAAKGTATLPFGESIQIETPGWAEYDLVIEITGERPTDFTFSLALRRSHLSSGSRLAIAAGYLKPITGGWVDRGIAATEGDLLVAELELKQNAAALAMTEQECGYRVRAEEAVEQVRLSVNNYETSVDILDLPLAYNPDLYGQYQWNANHFVITGKLLHIGLSDLSLLLRYVGEQRTLDDTVYQTVTSSVGDLRLFTSGAVDVKAVKTGCEIVIRAYVHGKKVEDRSVGLDLGTAALLDSTWPAGSRTLLLEDTGTYWQGNAPPFVGDVNYDVMYYNRHWLLDKVFRVLTTIGSIEADYADFVSITMADALTALGGHLQIADWYRDYTPDYWNDVIVDAVWNVMNGASITSHFYARYLQLKTTEENSGLFDTTTPFSGYERIYDFPTGKMLALQWWGIVANDVGYNYYLSKNYQGFYGLIMPSVWTNEPVVTRLRFVDSYDYPAPLFTYPTTTVAALETNLLYRVPDVVPADTVLASEVYDVISHENGSTAYSHLAAYNAAYNHTDSLTDYAPRFRIEEGKTAIWDGSVWTYEPAGRITYIYDWNYSVNGAMQQTGMIDDLFREFQILDHPSLARVPTGLFSPRCNGAWAFV